MTPAMKPDIDLHNVNFCPYPLFWLARQKTVSPGPLSLFSCAPRALSPVWSCSGYAVLRHWFPHGEEVGNSSLCFLPVVAVSQWHTGSWLLANSKLSWTVYQAGKKVPRCLSAETHPLLALAASFRTCGFSLQVLLIALIHWQDFLPLPDWCKME